MELCKQYAKGGSIAIYVHRKKSLLAAHSIIDQGANLAIATI